MTYHHSMAEVGQRLTRLLVIGGDVPRGDIAAALGGHAAIVQLLRTVHRDLSQHGPPMVDATVSEIQRNPVSVLGTLLRKSATPIDQAPSETLSATAESLAGEHWRGATRAAVVAEHLWSRSIPGSRPLGAEAWTEMADVAAVAEAIAILRNHIADSLVTAGRHSDALSMRRQAESGMRVAAHWVGLVALTGPLPTPSDLVSQPSDKVLLVQSADSLPEAFRRLEHQLKNASNLSPQAVEAVADANIAAAVHTIRALSAAGDLPAAGFLTRHIEELDAVMGTSARLGALMPSDPQIVSQTEQIHQFFRSLKKQSGSLSPVEAANLLHRIPDVTAALTEAALWQARSGRWLYPARRPQREGFRWRRLVEGRSEPEMLHSLMKARLQASEGRREIPRPSSEPEPRPLSPRVELGKALAVQPTAPRPSNPTIIQRNVSRRQRQSTWDRRAR